MTPYRVWASDRNQSCLLLAANEQEAFEIIAEMKIYGDQPLTAEADSDKWELPNNYVVLSTGATAPIPGRK